LNSTTALNPVINSNGKTKNVASVSYNDDFNTKLIQGDSLINGNHGINNGSHINGNIINENCHSNGDTTYQNGMIETSQYPITISLMDIKKK